LEGVNNPQKRASLNAFCFLNSRNSKAIEKWKQGGRGAERSGGKKVGVRGWGGLGRCLETFINKQKRGDQKVNLDQEKRFSFTRVK
jgi:hypothetical protein